MRRAGGRNWVSCGEISSCCQPDIYDDLMSVHCSAALTSFVPSSFPPSLLLSFPFPRRPPLPAVPARTALASLPLARHALFLPLPFHVLLAPALPSCLPPSFDPAGEASRSTSEGVGEEDSFVWERG
ncbi:hypothetical protein Naga_100446g5 [Nannochloropsis gaditana]|uniref:Uncharacterized protein n=1 Tax=Nannochloropsis gaditana TaxID=72520 RepID=W7TVZ1_9STRA|nr:hypothetical protein Naga_100446g5 [Nannochloropsis gaditana]